MHFKLFLLGLSVLALSFDTEGQKLKRKGTSQGQRENKEPAAKYSLGQLNGRWQEVKRIPAESKEPVGFSDSLLMNFYDDKVELKDATSMRISVKGSAQIDAPNSLLVAGDIYTILSLDKTKLVIDDGEFIRELQKKDQFYYETLGKLKIETDSLTHPVNIDINSLKGKWLVYSRKAQPGIINEQTALIRSLNITSVSEEGIAYGEIIFYVSDVTKTSSCQVVTKNGIIKIVTDKDVWNFNVYKADEKEFIFGETGKIIYFSKH